MTANLLSRLQGLTAPDREADVALWRMFIRPDASENTLPLPWDYCFTESLDATVALCERVLPGLHRALFQHPDGESLAVLSVPGMGDEGAANGHHKSSLCIALLIAILTALETRENG